MLRKWLGRLRRHSLPEPPPPTPEPAPRAAPPPPPPPRPAPRATAPRDPEAARVELILQDGTSVSPPDDPEWDEKFRYYAGNVIPGAGRSDKSRG